MSSVNFYYNLVLILVAIGGTLSANRLLSQTVEFNYNSGFYKDAIQLEISYSSDYELRYTLDGSNPNLSSFIYQDKLDIKDRTEQFNGIALIPTNPSNTFDLFRWRPPLNKVLKATVLKAALFQNGEQKSEIYAREYFIGSEFADIQLPIISIQIDSADLFDYETGLFVAGKDYDDNPNTWQPGNYFNRGEDWERTALFSFYNNNEQHLSQKVNLQIHGGASRIMPCKSLRISAKENLGKAYLDYPFFKSRPWQKYKRIILRNGGQDFHRAIFRDALMHSLVAKTQPYYQASQPAVVFINGIYWGIENIRERYDKYFLSNFHEEALEDVDYVEIAMAFNSKEGSAEDLENLFDELLILDLTSKEDYSRVSSEINIENYIDLHISKVYAGGTDWSGNNERIYRATPSIPSWNWMASDYDDTFRNIDKQSFAHATNDLGDDWPNPEWSTRLFRGLMANAEFANQYKNRLKELLRTVYHPDQLIPVIDSVANLYRNEMPRQIDRWTYPASMLEWEGYIDEFKNFAQVRSAVLLEEFELKFPQLNVGSSGPSVFPNPTADFCFVSVPRNWTGKMTLEIYNSLGQLLSHSEITSNYENRVVLNNIPAGVHWFRIRAGSKIYTEKLEIVR